MPLNARTRTRTLAGNVWEGRVFNVGIYSSKRNVRDVRGHVSDAASSWAPLWPPLNKCLVLHHIEVIRSLKPHGNDDQICQRIFKGRDVMAIVRGYMR